MTPWDAPVQAGELTRSAAEDLLFHESRLLDERRFAEWHDLFAAECVYWVPGLREHPGVEPSMIYDDHERLGQRVYRLTETTAHAQLPASETQRHISNVEVDGRGPEGTGIRVGANVLIFEVRRGDPVQVGLGDQRVLSGRCFYDLTPTDRGWRIAQKKVVLLTRGLPQYNLSFLI
jgi:3-phenylpropionate/cinnamic acid dioxygenase small subunit